MSPRVPIDHSDRIIQATELLIGLWLADQPQDACERIISSWRRRLTAESGISNENTSSEIQHAKHRAVALLDATCEACAKECPMRTIIRPAPLKRGARRA